MIPHLRRGVHLWLTTTAGQELPAASTQSHPVSSSQSGVLWRTGERRAEKIENKSRNWEVRLALFPSPKSALPSPVEISKPSTPSHNFPSPGHLQSLLRTELGEPCVADLSSLGLRALPSPKAPGLARVVLLWAPAGSLTSHDVAAVLLRVVMKPEPQRTQKSRSARGKKAVGEELLR